MTYALSQSAFTAPPPEPLPTPRPFQSAAILALRERLANAIANGIHNGKKIIVCAPTGGGKTIFSVMVIAAALAKGKRVLFVCDRKTLINQTSATFDRYGFDHGIVQAGNPRFNLCMQLQVCSIQTINRREWPDCDLIIYDEAHGMPKALTSHLKDFSGTVLGLTATPFTKGMGKVYGQIINATTMHELTESGVLVPWRVLSGHKIDMKGAATGTDGEWSDDDAGARTIPIIGDIIGTWLEHARGLKTIAFCANTAACEELRKQCEQNGIEARLFTYETTDKEREIILDDFVRDDHKIKMLITVEALAKGFDCVSVRCIIDARPLRKSLATVIQMIGRGLRSAFLELLQEWKKECIVLDFSGNMVRFADDIADLFFNGVASLDDGEKLNKAVRKDDESEPGGRPCPMCGNQPCGRKCVACGWSAPKQNTQEVLAGELKEVDIFSGKKALAKDAGDLFGQLLTYTTTHGNPEFSTWRAKKLYSELSKGAELPKSVIRRREKKPITTEVLNMIKRRNIAYANRPMSA